MVLGLRSRGKKGVPVSLAFDIALQEVKPWPSKSLPPLVMIQWQRGEKRTGGTKCVAPGKDRVTFNDSFRIPATLYMLADKKKGNPKFQKKCIVFSLFEVQADKITPRGQPLARAVLDLADYGTLDRRAMSSIPMAVARKEFSALGTPHISFTIAPHGKNAPAAPIAVDKVPSISSSSTSKVADEESQDSLIAALMSDEDDDIASFTDDEGSIPSTPASEAKSESPRPEPAHTPPPVEIPKDLPEVRSERVQRILSSVAQSSPASSAAAAAASAYASKKIGASSRASSGDLSSESDGLPSPASAKAPTISGPSTPSSVPEASAVHDGGTKKSSGGVEKTEINLKSSAPGSNVQNQSLQKAGKEKMANDSGLFQRGRITSETTKGIDTLSEAADDRKKDINVLQAARMKFAEGAGERSEKLDRKAVEEARLKAANAEAKATAAEEKARLLEREMDNLRAELRDAAALELALYSVVAQHGSSSHKIHSPARRLARIYIHACKHSSQDRRASTARTCASGLVVAARACENDVSRLTFWWSNVVVLREMISQAFDITPSSSSPKLDRSASIAANGTKTGEPAHGLEKQGSQKINLNGISNDWRETATLTSILERIEAWIFGRIVECIWWQSLTPHMQASPEQMYPSSPTSAETSVVSRLKRSVRGLIATDFGDSRQGNLSIEIWKSAFLDALQRICPVRAGGHDCGCLRVVTKMIIEQCVARLDVAMFNAILRDLEENVPTDPISDPITELTVLPISPDGVSFSGGAQLKNVINTWSTWLLTLTGESAGDAAQEVVEKGHAHFTLLRAMSDLLMLPKDMLMDKTVRKEVCPALNLLLIRRILSKFVPDEFSPDPAPPSLLAALNAEISMERQRVGEADISASAVVMASAPPVVYFPPSPASICDLFVDTSSDNARLSRSTSLIRKGHTSDDELEEIESPLSLLVDTSHGSADGSEPNELPLKDASAKRYRLLREVWS